MSARSQQLRRLRRRLVVAPAFAIGAVLASAAAASAQVPNPPPDGSAPGAELVTTVLGWLKWAGLAASFAGLLIGAIATGVGHFGSNHSASSVGRKWLMGGMGAAILSGLSWTIATTLYTATGG